MNLCGPLHLPSLRLLTRRCPPKLLLAAIVALSIPGRAFAADLLISEFRFRGPQGAGDEFVELYNNTDSNIVVATADGSAGWALAASDGLARFVIPNNTTIPPRAHYLATNSGYSLGAYGGNAAGNITYSTDIPDEAGIAVFRTASPANFNLTTRLDAVGYSTAPALYREGTGFSSSLTFNTEHSYYRNLANGGLPQDTDNNTADFLGVDTEASPLATGQRLGAPGPENLASPIQRNAELSLTLLDPAACAACAPNRFRDTTSPSGTNGVLIIRRKVTNNSARTISRLRFRIVDITTFPAPSGTADLRALTSANTSVTLTDGTTVNVQGTILEQPPLQPNGGGWSSSLTLPAQGLAPGASTYLQFVTAVEQSGYFRFYVNIEAD